MTDKKLKSVSLKGCVWHYMDAKTVAGYGPWMRHQDALALVAEAYEVAADRAQKASTLGDIVPLAIRSGAPSDAQAARDARDAEVRRKARNCPTCNPHPHMPATVNVQEAARVLLDRWMIGDFEESADAVADDAITDQWAHVDRTYPDAAPIIEAWLRALAGQGGEA